MINSAVSAVSSRLDRAVELGRRPIKECYQWRGADRHVHADPVCTRSKPPERAQATELVNTGRLRRLSREGMRTYSWANAVSSDRLCVERDIPTVELTGTSAAAIVAAQLAPTAAAVATCTVCILGKQMTRDEVAAG